MCNLHRRLMRRNCDTESNTVMTRMKCCCLLLLLVLCLPGVAQDPPAAAKDEAEIRAIEKRWDEANLRGDWAALDRIFADRFIMTGDDGKVHSKADVIGKLKARTVKYDSAKTDEVKILLHGDTAVVSGRWTGKYTVGGKAVELRERFTNVYARVKGKWQCIASHGSAIK